MGNDDDFDRELAEVVSKGAKDRLAATEETAPEIVDQLIEMMLSPIDPRPVGRTLDLEICAVACHQAPKTETELGPDHPLSKRWSSILAETIARLQKGSVDRFIKANSAGTLRSY